MRKGAAATILLTTLAAACASPQQAYSPVIPESINPQTLGQIAAPAPTAIIPYGDTEQQTGEWRMPEGEGPFPAVLMVHGGCWIDAFADRKSFAPLAAVLADQGIASYNIDYRALGVDGAGWPGTWQDWARAASMFDALTKQYPIDRDRLAVLGHSAGVNASWWLAARSGMADDAPFAAKTPRFATAIHLDGPTDLSISAPYVDKVCPPGTFARFFGGSPEEHPAYFEVMSVADNPAPGVSQLYIQGAMMATLDAGKTLAAMREGGADVTLVDVPNAGHLRMIVPGTQDQASWHEQIVAQIKGPQ